jgi:drug/metabolite transporter (DMT)-like permease
VKGLSKRTKAEALLVVATFIWGASFVVVKEALTDATPIPFLAVRFTLASLLLLVVMGRGQIDRKAILPGVILGLFLFAGFIFQTWGLLDTTPSKSAFITGFSVILVPIIIWFRGSRLRTPTVVGSLLGLIGLYCLVLPPNLTAVNRGDIFTLLGAVAFAFHIVLVGSYTRRFSFRQLVPTQILVVGLLSTLSLPFDPNLHLAWTARLIFALVVTAVLATGFAITAQNWAQQYTPAAHAAIIFTLEPLFAALTSWLVTAEHFGGRFLVGAGLIMAGMIVSELWGGSVPSPPSG